MRCSSQARSPSPEGAISTSDGEIPLAKKITTNADSSAPKGKVTSTATQMLAPWDADLKYGQRPSILSLARGEAIASTSPYKKWASISHSLTSDRKVTSTAALMLAPWEGTKHLILSVFRSLVSSGWQTNRTSAQKQQFVHSWQL
jgi:hypothetical protein